MLNHCVLCVLHIFFPGLSLEGSWTRPWFRVVVSQVILQECSDSSHYAQLLGWIKISLSFLLPPLPPLCSHPWLLFPLLCSSKAYATLPIFLMWYSWLPWVNTSSLSLMLHQETPQSLLHWFFPCQNLHWPCPLPFSSFFFPLNYIFTLLF